MEDQLFFDELLKACEMMNSNETTAIGAESVDNFFDFETLRLTENQVLQLKDVKPVRSARQAKDKEFVQSSAEYQVLHLQEKKRFRLSPRAQDKQVFPSSVSRSAYVQEFQLVEFPAHAQGIQLVLPPIDVQEKHLVESYAPVEEKQPVQSQVQDIQTPRSPTHVLARVQEITEYLIAHELWQVPDSVLYEEPVETECDLETSVEINDPTDAAGEVAYVGEIDILNGEGDVHLKARKRGGRRHRGQFMKRPMALTEVIEEMQRHDLRENALRCLSGHLVEEESDTEVMWQRREQDPDFYRQAGFFIFHSCSTLIILIQEILVVYERFNAGDLNVRGSKRLCNVLVLLQSVAANDETRLNFVKACLPNYLIPIILSEYTDEVYENLRALSLSVISIVCQAREKEVIKWALQNDIVEVCFHALDIGSELSKVIGMTILDSILRVDEGLSAICEPSSDLLPRFIKLCGDLVSVLAVIRGFSPRLLFLVVRSFILLCQNCRALELLKDKLPPQLEDTTFRDVKMEYPLFNYLRHQLLLCIGKAKDYLPSVDPSPASPASSSSSRSKREDKSSLSSGQATTESVVVYVTPMRPINLNKQDWSARLLL